ncbi:MAG TPA: hypothetical protein VMC41_01225 [Candidatus Nanoarchaeia archaeon]|nr:hypothetical protein [Candidatus Nanoarchaeia archaeon]
MKKIIIGLIIIIGAVVIILHIIPVAAKSSSFASDSIKSDQSKLVVQIAPPPPVPAKATSTPMKKVTMPKPAASAKTATAARKSSVRWSASGLSAVGSLSSFDYSSAIRNAYMRKVEAYAKSKGITLITAAVVNSMHQ